MSDSPRSESEYTKRRFFECDAGHRYESTNKHRARLSSESAACPFCNNRLVLAGFNDIDTLRPDLAEQLVDQSLRTSLMPGQRQIVEWCCSLGHQWSAGISRRAASNGLGSGCPFCAGVRVWPGFNDLQTTEPHLAAQLFNQELASTLSRGSGKKVEWQCVYGHRWMSTVANRVFLNNGCVVCSGRQFVSGVNDLATTHPHLVSSLVDPSIATRVSKGSSLRAEWICEAGHVSIAPIASRAKGHGCPDCFGTGYRQDQNEARLYLILPPGKHPIGYGKVHSEQRYEYAMSTAYEGCQPLAYAVGTGISVSDAESCINAIKGRPTGKIERLRRESLERSQASIDLWEQTCRANGLEVTWLVERDSIILESIGKPRVHAELDFCGCAADGLNRHDSKSMCCKQGRNEAIAILAGSHYLGCGPSGTIHCFTWRVDGEVKAIVTLGTGSNSLNGKSLSTYSGIRALELTRLWASPDLDMTLSSFVSRCLDSIEYPLFVYSYADASEGHTGGIYRACSFNYAGWSDMTRSQPLRRAANRATGIPFSEWEVLSAKHRYWKLVGLRGKRKADAIEASGWPCYDPKTLGFAPAVGHRRVSKRDLPSFVVAAR